MFSCEFCEIFNDTLFTEHLPATASVITIDNCIKNISTSCSHICGINLVGRRTASKIDYRANFQKISFRLFLPWVCSLLNAVYETFTFLKYWK